MRNPLPRRADRGGIPTPTDRAPSVPPSATRVVSCRQPTLTTTSCREPIAREVECQDRQGDGYTRDRGHPWRLEDRLTTEGRHPAPGNRAAANAKPEKAE